MKNKDSQRTTRLTISAITPLSSDPNMRQVRIGRRVIATLRAVDVESLKLEIDLEWSAALAGAVEEMVAMNKARGAALRRLGRRPYSRAELFEKLIAQNHATGIARKIVDELAADRWIDDEEYARTIVDQVSRKPVAERLLAAKLESRQIDPGLSRRVIREKTAGVDPVESALTLARRRLGSMPGLPASTIRRRVTGALSRRGFDDDIIQRVLDRLGVEEDSAD